VRFLGTGPRSKVGPFVVKAALLERGAASSGPHTMVVGDCPEGADMLLEGFARQQGWQVETHRALWDDCGEGCPSRRHRIVRTPGDRFHPGTLPDWCPVAGPRRNKAAALAALAEAGEAECVAILAPCRRSTCRRTPKPHPTHGTANCVTAALDLGIPVFPYGEAGLLQALLPDHLKEN
jgi:hypothetical protein